MTDRREGNLAKRNLLIAVQARRRPFPPFCAVFARSCTVESPQKSPQNLRVRYRPRADIGETLSARRYLNR